MGKIVQQIEQDRVDTISCQIKQELRAIKRQKLKIKANNKAILKKFLGEVSEKKHYFIPVIIFCMSSLITILFWNDNEIFLVISILLIIVSFSVSIACMMTFFEYGCVKGPLNDNNRYRRRNKEYKEDIKELMNKL